MQLKRKAKKTKNQKIDNNCYQIQTLIIQMMKGK